MCGLCTFLSPLRVSSFFFLFPSVAPLISNELAVSDSLKFLLSAVAFFLCSWGNIVLFFFRTHFSYFGFDSLLFYLYYSFSFYPKFIASKLCIFFAVIQVRSITHEMSHVHSTQFLCISLGLTSATCQ